MRLRSENKTWTAFAITEPVLLFLRIIRPRVSLHLKGAIIESTHLQLLDIEMVFSKLSDMGVEQSSLAVDRIRLSDLKGISTLRSMYNAQRSSISIEKKEISLL
ncbi:hypothetical protein Zmor_021002 [Zophobas morio]|uniref:Uncharacterized protein n=1 Tax=Zophobas morio TaxID=2755281 RepID=A0AA38I5K1_9CUCU|nr:hypothetical protein Zmor_021002 [Zophobas morio]